MSQDKYEKVRRKIFKRRVIRVKDGDTFVVDKPIEGIDTVRLSGVDTPELGSGEKADEMTDFLTDLVLGRRVKLTVTGYNRARGNWPGRWVCEVKTGMLWRINVCNEVQKELTRKPWWKKLGDRIL